MSRNIAHAKFINWKFNVAIRVMLSQRHVSMHLCTKASIRENTPVLYRSTARRALHFLPSILLRLFIILKLLCCCSSLHRVPRNRRVSRLVFFFSSTTFRRFYEPTPYAHPRTDQFLCTYSCTGPKVRTLSVVKFAKFITISRNLFDQIILTRIVSQKVA